MLFTAQTKTLWFGFITGFVYYYTFFFFFQAEDGIRDYKVTGVQTCALPIFHPLGRVQEAVERAQRGQRPGHGALREPALLHRPEPAPDGQPVHSRPAPGPAVVAVAERGEVLHVPPVGLDRMGRIVPFLREEGDEGGALAVHAVTPTPIPSRSANRSISASARSASSRFFRSLSRTGCSSGSSSPKLAFIGWKGSGAAVCP